MEAWETARGVAPSQVAARALEEKLNADTSDYRCCTFTLFRRKFSD